MADPVGAHSGPSGVPALLPAQEPPVVAPGIGPAEAESTHPAGSSPAARRVRDRLRLGSKGSSAPAILEPLLATLRTNHPRADLRPVQAAFDLAYSAHEGQVRRSGEAYITHPVAVGQILADLGMDVPTVVAAILHDVVEDTQVSIELVSQEFGPLVAMVVDGVTKLDQVSYGEHAQAETIRKMVVAMARDPRVLVVKLADRLHNMRTLGFLPPVKQEKKARETLEIFAPLAHRLGMNAIKWELEDLAFATLQPKVYDEIVRLVADRAPARESFMAKVIEETEGQLKSSRIKATVTGRPKHYYSIYQKMILRGRDFADIYDLVGVRVLVDDVRDCYAALGQIHASWNPVPGRFKDFIAMPKFNMYQSLHTTVIGPTGKPVEFQIRTWEMHKIADLGIAAHWKYKDALKSGRTPSGVKGVGAAPADDQQEMAWLRQILDWQRETSDPSEFLDSLRYDLHAPEVFVFTPKGDVVSLPAGSTPVDFAYSVHTEVGHRCIGSRVNGRLVPLESQLKNGDTIEIFTSKAESAGPSRDWLSFVASSRAKSKIRHWFAKERREDALEHGKDSLSRAMRKAGLPLQRLFAGPMLVTIARDLRFQDVESLYVAVGEGHLSAGAVVQRLTAFLGGPDETADEVAEVPVPARERQVRHGGSDAGVIVAGHADMWVKLARCCTPVPGDDIVGFVTRGQGVSVHQRSCTNVEHLLEDPEQAPRFVDVEWAPRAGSVFLVCIQVEALDRQRLLSDVTRVLSDAHVNILSAYVHTSKDRTAISRFTFEMGGPEHLGHLLRMVKQIDGVFDAYRVTASS